jgi:hypothetical protein
MTPQELKDYILAQLTAPVNEVLKVINSFFAVIDFTTTEVASIIPEWTAVQTFNTDGSVDGVYCKHPDDAGNVRIFETLTDGNINNEPPTNPAVTSNAFWAEISSSASAPIPEWAPGIYGPGQIIVYHEHSTDGHGLYILLEPVRPFNSVNIETELTAGDWAPISSGGAGSGLAIAATYATIAALLADQAAQETGAWYMVDDASTDTTVDGSGWAIYEKLAATTAALTDYLKRGEQESLDVTFPDGSETVAGKFEEATDGETQAGTAVGATGAKLAVTPAKLATWWTWVKTQAQTFAAAITFTSAPIFSSTTASQFLKVDGSKALTSVAGAAASDLRTGTDTTKPLTAGAFKDYIDPMRSASSVSAGTATLNCADKVKVSFEDTATQSSNWTLAFSSDSNAEEITYSTFITGTRAITMPSNVLMETGEEGIRWVNSTKILTLVGTTASPIELSFKRINGSKYLLRVGGPYYAS